MAKAPQPFSLPEEGRRSLTTMLKKGIHRARKLNRARVLLKLDEGLGPAQAARETGVGEATVYRLRDKAERQGWARAIEEEARSGRPAEIAAPARAQITALACSKPPQGHARWTLRLLRDKAIELGFVDSISHEGVREILKKTRSSRT